MGRSEHTGGKQTLKTAHRARGKLAKGNEGKTLAYIHTGARGGRHTGETH